MRAGYHEVSVAFGGNNYDTLNPGSYKGWANYSGTRIYKCVYIAKSIVSGSQIYRDSIYMVLHQPDASATYLGYTSEQGGYSTDDRLAFPNLYKLTLTRTTEQSSDPVGNFSLSDSVDISISDTTTGKYMSIVKKIEPSANQFEITWNPSIPNVVNIEAQNANNVFENRFQMVTDSLPAELTSFSATANVNSVLLQWKTATEINLSYFGIQRSTDAVSWTQIGSVQAAGISNSPKSYSYTDFAPNTGTKYYRLNLVSNDGTVYFSSVVSVVTIVPTWKLFQNYPNPYN